MREVDAASVERSIEVDRCWFPELPRNRQTRADLPDLGTGVANCPLSSGRLSVLVLNLSLALSLSISYLLHSCRQLHSIAREKAA